MTDQTHKEEKLSCEQSELEVKLEEVLEKAQQTTSELQNQRQVSNQVLHETYTL